MGKGYGTVVSVLVNEFQCVEGDLSPDTTMEDVDLDSLAQVLFAVALEEQTGLRFHESQITLDTTVGQIAAVIDASSGAAAEAELPVP
ncbi:acyl carrier protein [Streptomyces sp. NPDC051597]|uniref:acyl carrier protein n=1 Tax=Streptomyces sp. NPDC051597 TaxID=3155049 RepID=UPI003442D4D3